MPVTWWVALLGASLGCMTACTTDVGFVGHLADAGVGVPHDTGADAMVDGDVQTPDTGVPDSGADAFLADEGVDVDAGLLNCFNWSFTARANGHLASATVDGAFSLDGWLRVLEAPSGGYGQLVGVEPNPPCQGAVDRWALHVDASGTLVTVNAGASFTTTAGSGGSVSLGTWFHVALVFDGSATVRLYVDGTLAQTQSSSGVTYPAACALHVASEIQQGAPVSIQLASLRLSTGERFVSDFDASLLRTLAPSTDTAWLFDVADLTTYPLIDLVAGLELRSDAATTGTASPECL